MKKILLVIALMLCVMLSACKTTENTESPQVENKTDVVTNEAKNQEQEESKTPDSAMLEGEWTLAGGMSEGEEYTAEDAGYTTEITFKKNGDGLIAHYWRDLNGLRQEFDAEVQTIYEPVYEGCGNDEWSAIFMIDGELPDKDEFYFTLTGEDKLLLKHTYIIDHHDGSMGMSYAFYNRK